VAFLDGSEARPGPRAKAREGFFRLGPEMAEGRARTARGRPGGTSRGDEAAGTEGARRHVDRLPAPELRRNWVVGCRHSGAQTPPPVQGDRGTTDEYGDSRRGNVGNPRRHGLCRVRRENWQDRPLRSQGDAADRLVDGFSCQHMAPHVAPEPCSMYLHPSYARHGEDAGS